MISTINRNLITPLYYKWNNDNRLQYLKNIEKTQWLSLDEILSKQFIKFRKIFTYAYNNSKFYKNLYINSGIEPEDLKCLDDIKSLPIVSKQDLQKNLESMISSTYPLSQRYQDASGGSTGFPTIFYGDKNALPVKFAAMMMFDKWSGWNIGEKSAYLWGADREVNRVKFFKEKIVQKIVYRTLTLNAFDLTEKKMNDFAKILIQKSPTIIVAYANAALTFAKHVNINNIKGIKLKGIICSAETLREENRKFIEDIFRCKVLNRYGSREVGLIACECDHQKGLHINANDLLVEYKKICQNDHDGEKYEIIVTDFNNYAMPFIKYNMGDIAVPLHSQCTCGRGFPLMSTVQGRTSDFIKHSSGRMIHGEYFSHIFYGIDGVRQFQVIQESIKKITIYVVKVPELTQENKKYISSKVYETMGNDLHIDIFSVNNINTPPSGKFRFVISKI